MRRLLSILLAFTLLGVTTSDLVLVASFKIRQSAIAAKWCENHDLRGPANHLLNANFSYGSLPMPSGIERVREIKRLRTRRKKVAKLLARAKAGTR